MMIKRIKQQMDWVALLVGIGTVFIGYFAWGLLTATHRNSLFGVAGFLFSVLTMFFYALFCRLLVKLKRKDLGRQIMAISGWGVLICLLLLLGGGGELFMQREYAKLVMNILWLADFAGCVLYLKNKALQDEVNTDQQTLRALVSVDSIRTVWRKHKYFYILLAVTLLLLIEPDAMQFKWDGLLYYLTCRDLSLDSISSLAIYGHIAQTYGMFNGLGTLIVGDTAAAMVVINSLLFLCSVCAFYGIMKCTLPGKQDFVCALVTAAYAWSPFTLGMVFYHNLDFYCQCFFVIMLYFLYRRQWIYFFAASMLFCFTKEPAILIYGALCVGVVLLDFLDQTGLSFGRRLGNLLGRKQYYFMVLPGILWLATYKMLGPWSAGEGSFQIDRAYVIEKLKVLYVFQFNWLFTVLCVGGAVFCFVTKRKEVWRSLFPILCGQFAFTVFSCVFSTVNHPRYNGASQPALYCMAILLTACFLEHLWGRVLAGGVALLMAISSFFTIDPVTLLCFSGYNVGETTIVTTGNIPLGDGMIYNRQMLWLEHALGMALEDSLAKNSTIFFPALDNNTYFFDGMAEVGTVKGDWKQEEEYWDAREGRRTAGPEDGTESFTVFHLSEDPDWDEIAEKLEGKGNYFYLSCAGEERAEEIREHFSVLEEEEYVYRGWRVHRICFL